MRNCFIIVFILFTALSRGQTRTDSTTAVADTTAKKGPVRNWDTTRYQKFDYVLIVGIYQQYRNFSNEFKQLINKDTLGLSSHVYVAESQLNSGIVFNYDKFQISFGTRSSPQSESAKKGYTKTFNIGFNFGDNRWVSESYYRRFTGFYNSSTGNFDTTFKKTGDYYLLPNLKSSLFSSRAMYFTNFEKFSYKSGFGCNYRQLKSAFTWIIGASFNVYTLKSDSSVIPMKARPLFNDYGGLKGFQSTNIGMNFGAAGTLVLFKAWFASAYFTLGPEQQWRHYDLGNSSRHLSYISWSGTGRLSFGLNLKRCYILGSYSNDYNLYSSPKIIDFRSNSITGNFTFGWRFHTGTPKFYQKFQQTKVYKVF
ncbi:MAG: hypothetical protein K0S32_2216 [Bacteroidetes bacterium]|jgi:hypothetical protein|nr:hypothetical protein [Bacteroidota bacterium]